MAKRLDPFTSVGPWYKPGSKGGRRSLCFGVSQKGSPERCRFRFFPIFSVFFRFFRFFRFFSVFFRFFPFFSVFSAFSFRFLPIFPFFPFHFQKKTGRHRSRDPFCETPNVLQFTNAVVLNAVVRRKKERKCARKSGNERKRAQTQVCKRTQKSASA